MDGNGWNATGHTTSPDPELMRAINKAQMEAAQVKVSRETDVMGQIGYQDKLIMETIEYVRKLEERLSSVLRSTGPAPIAADSEREELVPLASKIRSNNEGIMTAIAGINSILNRLEL